MCWNAGNFHLRPTLNTQTSSNGQNLYHPNNGQRPPLSYWTLWHKRQRHHEQPSCWHLPEEIVFTKRLSGTTAATYWPATRRLTQHHLAQERDLSRHRLLQRGVGSDGDMADDDHVYQLGLWLERYRLALAGGNYHRHPHPDAHSRPIPPYSPTRPLQSPAPRSLRASR
ncbi:hypothetical protein BV337_05747 [Pseudomonas syringae pv. actinidiae]|nr:hypothetical protein BV345_05520 [Pseudomonas syringae pv. actinidiae]OSR98933.1 hypothetical protein BV334_05648 [Pseudomonas syringae pv. actinidiae]OSS16970.1 hypothetical protein BV337_05747 [Pseudomonas syringae pv. actinidiae]